MSRRAERDGDIDRKRRKTGFEERWREELKAAREIVKKDTFCV